MSRAVVRRCVRLHVVALLLLSMSIAIPRSADADIMCWDFESQAEAQPILDALSNDPFGIDQGFPQPDFLVDGDQEVGNGIACDSIDDLPEVSSPGDEEYTISDTPTENGLAALPDAELEQVTIQLVEYVDAIQTVENPDKLYTLMSVATPEFEIYADYEELGEIPAQCGAAATTARLQELLAPGTTVWLDVDEAGFFTFYQLDRHIWIQIEGRYRLLSEVLVSEGRAVVATERPGTGRADAATNPPPGSKYRDALRQAQEKAIARGDGIWTECAG